MKQEEINSYVNEQAKKGLDSVGCWQLKIAANMGLSKEQLELLSIPDLSFTNREWLYICFMDQVPLENLCSFPQLTAQAIIDTRNEHLKNIYGKVPQELETLQKEVSKQIEESRILHRFLEEYVEEENKNKEIFEKKASDLENGLEKAEQEKLQLKREIQRLKTEKAQIQKELELFRESNLNITENQETGKDKSEEEHVETENYKNAGFIKTFLHQRKEKRDQKEFLLILQDQKLTIEQKSFLIRCREEGDSIEVIRNIAYQSFELQTMKRIREMLRQKENG